MAPTHLLKPLPPALQPVWVEVEQGRHATDGLLGMLWVETWQGFEGSRLVGQCGGVLVQQGGSPQEHGADLGQGQLVQETSNTQATCLRSHSKILCPISQPAF